MPKLQSQVINQIPHIYQSSLIPLKINDNQANDIKKFKINETILSGATRADVVEFDSINDRSSIKKDLGSILNKK